MSNKGKHRREEERTIASAFGGSYLCMAVEDAEKENYPSVVLFIQVRDDVMSGWFRPWIGLDELANFVDALRPCEKTRRVEAHLSGLSPDKLRLSIEQMDSWGHFRLRYALGYMSHSERELVTRTMSGGFDLDASLFEQHVSLFEFLLEDAKTRPVTL